MKKKIDSNNDPEQNNKDSVQGVSNRTLRKGRAGRRRLQVAMLMADPTAAPSHEEAAKMLGVSSKTIQRDLQAVRPDMVEVQGMLAEYKRLLFERMPIPKRVSLYEEIANSSNPFAKLKALERIDELSGIITDEEAMKSRRGEEPHEPVPMFILPEGARISVTVNQVTPTPTRDDDPAAMRNVTPPAIETNAGDEGSTNE